MGKMLQNEENIVLIIYTLIQIIWKLDTHTNKEKIALNISNKSILTVIVFPIFFRLHCVHYPISDIRCLYTWNVIWIVGIEKHLRWFFWGERGCNCSKKVHLKTFSSKWIFILIVFNTCVHTYTFMLTINK